MTRGDCFDWMLTGETRSSSRRMLPEAIFARSITIIVGDGIQREDEVKIPNYVELQKNRV